MRSPNHNWLILGLLLLLVLQLSPLSVTAEDEGDSPKSKRPKVGLVLSGGGAKGFAYIGLFRVLEEVGLPIDYVGGTSIGSIMAGMYAVGYSADEIERVVREQDWNAVLKDEIPRKYVAYEEKELWENSIVSLPVSNRKIGLNSSLYYGQQVNLLLNKFFSPAWNVTDFNDLPTPFVCMATDLLNGESVELNSGYLPMAVRSSMSIPGYFSATYYDNRYLVDGGVVNNYPAAEVKDMGAQFLIGGDVQSGLKDNINQLSSVPVIIDQIITFDRVVANKNAAKLLDIDIKFDVTQGMMDFVKFDSIIAEGERVARAHYDELKKLADSLNSLEYREPRKMQARPLEYLDIAEIYYEGNNKMSTIFLDNYFEDFKNKRISQKELQDKITLVYGTGFFQYVFYELQPTEDGRANLIIKVEEGAPGYVSAAIHFDVDYLGSIMVGDVFRNVLGNRSKIFGELILGSNPRLKVFYTISNGEMPGFGAELEMYKFSFYDYYKDVKVNKIDYSALNFSAFLTRSQKNILNWRLGLQYEYFRFKEDVQTDPDLDSISTYTSYANLFISLRGDTRDKNYFSTRGFKLHAKALYVTTIDNNWSKDLFTNSLVFFIKYDQNIPLSKRIVLRPGFFGGGTLKQDVPPIQHWFGAGGMNEINYIESFVPFAGVHFVQRLGLYSAIARMKMQYNVFGKFYFTASADLGNVTIAPEGLYDWEDVMFGYGGTLSYDSFIGPVEFSLLGSNLNHGTLVFFSLGFQF